MSILYTYAPLRSRSASDVGFQRATPTASSATCNAYTVVSDLSRIVLWAARRAWSNWLGPGPTGTAPHTLLGSFAPTSSGVHWGTRELLLYIDVWFGVIPNVLLYLAMRVHTVRGNFRDSRLAGQKALPRVQSTVTEWAEGAETGHNDTSCPWRSHPSSVLCFQVC